MTVTIRFYSSIAQQTSLISSVSPTATVVTVADSTGFPGSTPFTLSLDYGAPNEELVNVTDMAGTSMTVDRAIDGTSATTHSAGAIVRHVSSARDFADSRAHENASTNVHGLAVGSAVVGTTDTQTLSNKTLANTTFSDPTITGTVEGGATYDGITLTGAINGVTSLALTSPSSTGTPLTVSAASGQTADITQWKDSTGTVMASVTGSGVISGVKGISATANAAGVVPLTATGAASQTANLQQWKNSGGTVLADVDSTGRITANRGVDITQGTSASGIALEVAGAVSQTADIVDVHDSTGTVHYLEVQANGDVNVSQDFFASGNVSSDSGFLFEALTDIGGGTMAQTSVSQTVLSNTTETTLGGFTNVTLKAGRAYEFRIWGYVSSTTASYVYLRVRRTSVTGAIMVDQLRVLTNGSTAINTPVDLRPVLLNATGADITLTIVLTAQATAGSTPAQWSNNGSTTQGLLRLVDVGLASQWVGFQVT